MSRATLKRDLQYLRERLDARSSTTAATTPTALAATRGRAHELPGLWFSDKEIHALLTMHQLIQGLEAEGVLGATCSRCWTSCTACSATTTRRRAS